MLTKTEITFDFRGQKKVHKFFVYHNLPKDHDRYNIDKAFDDWIKQAYIYTASNFSKYVMTKHESFVCMTETQFKRINQLGT